MGCNEGNIVVASENVTTYVLFVACVIFDEVGLSKITPVRSQVRVLYRPLM